MRVESPDVLEDGHWVNERGVMRWVADPTPPVVALATLTGLIACPSCHAKINETCRTVSGHTTTPHACRLVGRLCLCGASLAPRRRLCDACARKSLQESKNAYARRTYKPRGRGASSDPQTGSRTLALVGNGSQNGARPTTRSQRTSASDTHRSLTTKGA